MKKYKIPKTFIVECVDGGGGVGTLVPRNTQNSPKDKNDFHDMEFSIARYS